MRPARIDRIARAPDVSATGAQVVVEHLLEDRLSERRRRRTPVLALDRDPGVEENSVFSSADYGDLVVAEVDGVDAPLHRLSFQSVPLGA
jgi:hypothetical protein